jgi:hypothetical protein
MKISLERRAVLFIDLLDFKGKVEACETDLKHAEIIYQVLSTIKKHFANHRDIVKSQFSDSLVISFKAESAGSVIELVGSIQSLVKKVTNCGFLLRGGLAYGNLYHDKDFIFGLGMNKAYELESKKAIVPRIIIQKEIIEISKINLPAYFNEDMKEYVFNYITKDIDGEYYIDYFKKGVDTFWQIKNHDQVFVNNLKTTIINGLLVGDISVRLKYLWMKEKFNKLVKDLKENKQSTIAGITIGSSKNGYFYKCLEYIE